METIVLVAVVVMNFYYVCVAVIAAAAVVDVVANQSVSEAVSQPLERYSSINICSLETYSMLNRINKNNNNLAQNISTTYYYYYSSYYLVSTRRIVSEFVVHSYCRAHSTHHDSRRTITTTLFRRKET